MAQTTPGYGLTPQSQLLAPNYLASVSDTLGSGTSTPQGQHDSEWRGSYSSQPQFSAEHHQDATFPAQLGSEPREWHQKSFPEAQGAAERSDARLAVPRAQSSWMWEIAACVLSLSCMSAIVGVLCYEHGKQLDQWGLGYGSYSISPTAVVSLIGTIGRSACLLVIAEIISQLKWIHFDNKPRKLTDLETFDAASRGPWGAFLLMVSKHRTTLLATCASFIMLLSLLMDPFLQLVFEFPIKLTEVDGMPSKILTSHVYDPTNLIAKSNAWSYGSAQVHSSMQAAILSPIWKAQSPHSIPCSFERCDWPTITTLGVCGSCTNLTDSVQPSCASSSEPLKVVECNYTLPSINMTLGTRFGYFGSASDMTTFHTLWNSKAEMEPGYVSANGRLVNFAYIKLDPDLDWESYRGSTLPIAEAMNCSLTLCARTFTKPYFANATAGRLSGPKALLEMPDPPSNSIGNLEKINYRMLIELKAAGPDKPLKNTTFKINYFDFGDIRDYLYELFTQVYHTVPLPVNDEIYTVQITPNLGLHFNQNDDIPGLMDDIADSMTEAIRTSSNSTTIAGSGMKSQTFISVRWEWLILPISCVVLTVVLLLILIVRDRASPVPSWKSSSLPLIFHELRGWDRQEKEAFSPQGLQKVASSMRAQTVRDEGRLLFEKT
ncbi:hypothetical protein EDB80DRAFT_731062 [Ilyonectria destructans]|nr:hypothetical protein EDB80DRAFT_731062 [Ilyonectria destructans]